MRYCMKSPGHEDEAVAPVCLFLATSFLVHPLQSLWGISYDRGLLLLLFFKIFIYLAVLALSSA